MPSKSPSQARLMAGGAHDPAFAQKVGIPMKVGKEFNKADSKSGLLGIAERDRGSGIKKAAGGPIDRAAVRGHTKGKIY